MSSNSERGEYGGFYEPGEHLRTPDGLPRKRSTGERARLLRKAGLDTNAEQDPQEFGLRLR